MRTSARIALVGTVAALAFACSLTTSLSGLAGPPESTDGGLDARLDDGAQGDRAPGPDGSPDAPGDGDPAVAKYAMTVLADSPVLYYRLGESSTSGAAKDLSTSARNASFKGSVVTGVPGAIANDPDTACRFDGVTSAVFLAAGPAFAGKLPYSLEAWVKPSSFAGPSGHVVVACEQEPDDGYAIFFYLDARARSERETAMGTDGVNSPPLTGTGFTHIVGTFDGTAQRLYVDGVIVDTSASTWSIPGAAGVPFSIGANGNADANRFVGDIDEVAIYDHALSAQQISTHHKVGVGGN